MIRCALRPLIGHALLLVSFVSLLSCGGSGPGPDREPVRDKAGVSAGSDNGVARAASAVAAIDLGSIPTDAHEKGFFSGVLAWPLIPAHAVLMPDGRVLTYGTDGTGKQTGYFIYDIWNPADGLGSSSHLTLPNSTATDVFCSSALLLPQGGGVVIAGGDNWTGTATTNTGNRNSNVVNYASNAMTRGNDMNRARWYSTSTTLLNGETYVQGGSGGTDRPEVRGANGTYRLLSSADTSTLDFMYPRNFIAPDGSVFGYDSAGRMFYVNTSGSGGVTQVGQFATQYRGNDASAAMFRPGRILQFGGSSNQAVVIDINSGTPVLTPTQAMSTQRRLVNATILPNGRVMASGGSQTHNQLVNVNNTVEIWNPETGTWTAGATGVQARLYHSISLLMPDGSVIVGGGGAPGPQTNLNVEIYYPPYLFTSGGQLAPRPTIAQAPTAVDIGRIFPVELAAGSSAQRIVMIKSGAVTHSWNMEQRFVELAFTAQGTSLSVQAPTRAADAPPGFYMLFVLDASGVPSVAKIVRVNVASNPNPAVVPTIQNPGAQSTIHNAAVSLQINASDPNGDPLRYDATGLPTGMSINPTSGLISGAPGMAGNFTVLATVSDGVNNASTQFAWSVVQAAPVAIVPPSSNPPVTLGTTIQFSIGTQNGVNPVYRWDFGDGAATSCVNHTPGAAPVHRARCLHGDSECHRRSRHRDAPQLPASRSAAVDLVTAVALDDDCRRDAAERRTARLARERGQQQRQRLRPPNSLAQRGDCRRQRSAGARGRVQRPGLGDEQAQRFDQRDQLRHAHGPAHDHPAARQPATRHRRRTRRQPGVRGPRGDRRGAEVRHGDVRATRVDQCRAQRAPCRRQCGRGAALRVTLHHAAAAGRRHGDRVDAGRGRSDDGRRGQHGHTRQDRARPTATAPTPSDRGAGVPNYLGALSISPDGTQGWRALEAGQRPARRAA